MLYTIIYIYMGAGGRTTCSPVRFGSYTIFYGLIFHVWVLLDPRRSIPNIIFMNFLDIFTLCGGSFSAPGEYCPPGHPPGGFRR